MTTPEGTAVTTLAGVIGALAALSALVAACLVPSVERLAHRVGAIDAPGGRRQHAGPMPRLGGLAVASGAIVSVTAGCLLGMAGFDHLADQGWSLTGLSVASLVIVLVGLADDVRGLRPGVKLAGQLVAAIAAVLGGYVVHLVSVPLLGTTLDLGLVGVVLTVLWIVAVTNALNLIDGLDGLATGVALIASITLAIVSVLEGRPGGAVLGACLGGALAGFLPFNLPPARVFLGDSGSLLIGFWLSILSLQAVQKTSTAVLLLASILALGVPLLDTALAVVRRLVTAGPAGVFLADREHIHHRLLRSGRSPRAVLAMLYAACVAGGLLAFAAVLIRGPLNALVVGVAAGATWAAARWLGRR
jgi:UDP-GlcNAc:undecaprenyl-phosphate GlcNAc-1-phosphate transferase